MYQTIFKKKKMTLVLLFLFITYFIAFAQDTFLLYMYSQINDYVVVKDLPSVERVLLSTKASRDYEKLENYILIKAREQLVLNDLEMAMDLCYVVVDNNLDNFAAASLYDSIERTKKAQDEKQRLAAEREQIASIRQAETIKRDTQKIQKEYQTITNTASGQRVYLDQDVDDYFQTLTWAFGVGLASISLIVDLPNIEPFYGISALGNIFYRSDFIHAGLDVFAAMAFSSFSDLEFLPMKAEANLSFAFPKLAKHFYYRFGGAALLTYLDADSLLPEQFLSPTAGFALRDLGGDAFFANFVFDYHLGHLFHEELITSFSAGLNFYIKFADLKKADLGLIIGLEDSFFYTNSGIYNHAKLNLSIGVWNND